MYKLTFLEVFSVSNFKNRPENRPESFELPPCLPKILEGELAMAWLDMNIDNHWGVTKYMLLKNRRLLLNCYLMKWK